MFGSRLQIAVLLGSAHRAAVPAVRCEIGYAGLAAELIQTSNLTQCELPEGIPLFRGRPR
jgi:hypothetical protein